MSRLIAYSLMQQSKIWLSKTFCGSPTARLYACFFSFCYLIAIIYLFCVKMYHPLLLPTKFSSTKLLLYNGDLCSGAEEVTVMFVYSSIGDFNRRQIIRKTYANKTIAKKYKLRTFFVLGNEKPCKNDYTSSTIYHEYQTHKDIVIGDFHDSYRNLTLKGITALNFTHKHCKNARFVIKTDDDVLVNTPALLETLTRSYSKARYTMWGKVLPKQRAMYCLTNFFNKWCVRYSQYDRTYYPPYMFGGGYVMTADLVKLILNATKGVPSFPIDDVYMTGLLIEQVNKTQHINIVNWEKHVTDQPGETTERINKHHPEKLYFGHPVPRDQMESMWNTLRKTNA